MPLSKAKNRERMRQARLHKRNTDELVQPNIPLYDSLKHRSGDMVLVQKGKRLQTITIPELDGDGNPMPDYD